MRRNSKERTTQKEQKRKEINKNRNEKANTKEKEKLNWKYLEYVSQLPGVVLRILHENRGGHDRALPVFVGLFSFINILETLGLHPLFIIQLDCLRTLLLNCTVLYVPV